MQNLETGYNLVEYKLLGKRIQDIGDVMSITAFLRALDSKANFPQQLKVVGLDTLLAQFQDRELTRFIRRRLADAVDILLRKGPIILFPVAKVTMNAEPRILLNRDQIRLRPIFGNRLVQKDIGYFHAPFNIG